MALIIISKKNRAHDQVKDYYLNVAGIAVLRYRIYDEYFISTLRKRFDAQQPDTNMPYPNFSKPTQKELKDKKSDQKSDLVPMPESNYERRLLYAFGGLGMFIFAYYIAKLLIQAFT